MDHSCGQYWSGEEPQPQTPPRLLLESLLVLLLEMECATLTISSIYWRELYLSSSHYLASIPSLYLMVEPRPRAGPSVFSARSWRGVPQVQAVNTRSVQGGTQLPSPRECSPQSWAQENFSYPPVSLQVGSADRCPSVNQPCDQMTERQVWTLRGSFRKHFTQLFKPGSYIPLFHFYFIFLVIHLY